MNENIDLTKILKDCPAGTKLYSPLYGEMYFKEICSEHKYPIVTTKRGIYSVVFTKGGFYCADEEGECVLFPSKDQRDWSKFTAPWYKRERFDPKTLKPFDKVLVKDRDEWSCNFFSHIRKDSKSFPYVTMDIGNSCCIPYNDETKHLVGTTDEAPEYYRYWEVN